jgi:uncharacterized membrane protein
MGTVIWLLYAELFSIRNLCEYCTGIHIVTFLFFVLIVTSWPHVLGPDRSPER